MFVLLTFWTRSCSNRSILQLLVNMIMPQNLPSSYCNFTGSDLLPIRLSAKFDVDLCVTFLNFQYNPKSNDQVYLGLFRILANMYVRIPDHNKCGLLFYLFIIFQNKFKNITLFIYFLLIMKNVSHILNLPIRLWLFRCLPSKM